MSGLNYEEIMKNGECENGSRSNISSGCVDQFLGKNYILERSENFDEYLSFIGYGYLARKAALSLKPIQCLTPGQDADTYIFSYKSALASSAVTFRVGEQFDEVRPDGIKVKSVITLEGNKMIHTQTQEKGRVSRHVREFYPDRMIITTTAEGLDKVAKRYHVLQQQ